MKFKKTLPLFLLIPLLCACSSVSISPYEAYSVANAILAEQENGNVSPSNTYSFDYIENAYFKENKFTRIYELNINYSYTQKYFKVEQFARESQTINNSYKEKISEIHNWIYIEDKTSVFLVRSTWSGVGDPIRNKQQLVFVTGEEAEEYFLNSYNNELKKHLSYMYASNVLTNITKTMDSISFNEVYDDGDGTTLTQSYSSKSKDNLSASINLKNSYVDLMNEKHTYTNMINATFDECLILNRHEESKQTTSAVGKIETIKQYSISSELQKYVKIIKPDFNLYN